MMLSFVASIVLDRSVVAGRGDEQRAGGSAPARCRPSGSTQPRRGIASASRTAPAGCMSRDQYSSMPMTIAQRTCATRRRPSRGRSPARRARPNAVTRYTPSGSGPSSAVVPAVVAPRRAAAARAPRPSRRSRRPRPARRPGRRSGARGPAIGCGRVEVVDVERQVDLGTASRYRDQSIALPREDPGELERTSSSFCSDACRSAE